MPRGCCQACVGLVSQRKLGRTLPIAAPDAGLHCQAPPGQLHDRFFQRRAASWKVSDLECAGRARNLRPRTHPSPAAQQLEREKRAELHARRTPRAAAPPTTASLAEDSRVAPNCFLGSPAVVPLPHVIILRRMIGGEDGLAPGNFSLQASQHCNTWTVPGTK